MITNILAVDPGKATGWAFLSPGGFISGINRDQLDFETFVETMLSHNEVHRIVCEDYIVTQQTIQKSRQNYSLEIIGVMKWFGFHFGVPVMMQTPSQAKSFATDDKLKKLGWYKPSTNGSHDNDAARHLLVFAVNNGIIKPEELI